MSKLKTPIEKGDIKILLDKVMDSWNSLSSTLVMQDFLMFNKEPIDVVMAPNDNLASGALDAIKLMNIKLPLLTGQDATVDGCRNIMHDMQAMTIYKSKKLSGEGAILAMKVATGEKINITTTLNNGKHDVPSILFDPVVIDKSNLRALLIPDHIKESDLN
jgi:D-xylose transport system substrate-binding protein